MNKKIFLHKLGKHIKYMRKECGLIKEDFVCERMTLSVYIRIERGLCNVTLEKLSLIADVLGVEVKDLFDFE